MKKYLVIKMYNLMNPVVEASFDNKEDAVNFASLSKRANDNKYDYTVAQLV